MKIRVVEGFFDDLASLFDTPSMPEGAGIRSLNKIITPHTAEDLYQGVLRQLRGSKNATVKNEIAPAFFPDDAKKTTIQDIVRVKCKIPEDKQVASQLFDKYRDQMETVVVEYCSDDAMDIINRIQKEYTDAGKVIDEISGDIYFGTILDQVDKGQYDIIDKLEDLYAEFLKEAEKEEWQEDRHDSKVKVKSKDSDPKKAAVRKVRKGDAFKPADADKIAEKIWTGIDKLNTGSDKVSHEEFMDFMSNDIAVRALAGYIHKQIARNK